MVFGKSVTNRGPLWEAAGKVKWGAALAMMWIATGVLASDMPDPALTPGATSSAVTQANIQQTVCVKGYSKTIRPPAYYTNRLKKRQLREYGYADKNPRHYEEDHLIALSIGGAADDPLNLWPQPRNSEWGADKKDQLEFLLYRMVCAQEITLAEAQHAMAGNWIEAWKRYVPNRRNYRLNIHSAINLLRD